MKNYSHYFTAALLVFFVFLAGCASTAKEESTGEYIDDSVITTKVKAAFVEDDDLKAAEIKVETFKGVVQLSGFVANPNHVSKATKVAHEVPGVKSVKNDIRVK
jgi:osmotically-inducible protein OsmY